MSDNENNGKSTGNEFIAVVYQRNAFMDPNDRIMMASIRMDATASFPLHSLRKWWEGGVLKSVQDAVF